MNVSINGEIYKNISTFAFTKEQREEYHYGGFVAEVHKKIISELHIRLFRKDKLVIDNIIPIYYDIHISGNVESRINDYCSVYNDKKVNKNDEKKHRKKN